MKTEAQIRRQYERIRDSLDERGRREWAASEALALGHGGRSLVHRATGLVLNTIGRGIREIWDREREGHAEPKGKRRVRRPGGGRKRKLDTDPTLLADLIALIDAGMRGDPESPLRWTCKSLRELQRALIEKGHDVSHATIANILHAQGFSLQANRKTLEGHQHVDRDAQFEYINAQVKAQQAAGNPAISSDTKKKELVGNYKNVGRELRPKGSPVKVDVHDFMGELGRASPYGVYDILRNVGWVNVGVGADTAEFAVESIRQWWNILGFQMYLGASGLLITVDCGGSNGSRVRAWKLELQGLANELRFPITVCHLPPGTSKWNKIEHRLFSFITMNWRGKPLVDHSTIVSLIGATKTTTGLTVSCRLDPRTYEKGRKVSDAQMKTINLHPHDFHGEWNYTIKPFDSEWAKS